MVRNPLENDLNEILLETRDLWSELKGKRVFITGGTGFFGKWILESFAWANRNLGLGAEALVLSRDPEEFLRRHPHLNGNGVRFLRGDVETFEFPEGRFSHVIHAATAASAKLNLESPLVMFDNVLNGTRRALELASRCGAEKFLFTSSGAVYGRQPSDMTHVREDYVGGPDPLIPGSAYGEAKRSAEFLCGTYAREKGFEVKIARCYAFVGPYLPLDTHFAVGNFLRNRLRNEPIEVGGDGTPYRSYLYATELVIWLMTIWMKGRSLRPYNVGSEDGRPIAEIARAVAGMGGTVRVAKKADPMTAPERYVPSVARVKEELGLAQKIGLNEALARTLRFHQGGIQ